MTDKNQALLQIRRDINRLQAASEVKPILVSLGGSRRWGYSGVTSDHDVQIVYENRNGTELLDTPETFLFSTENNFNYTGTRVDKLMKAVASSNVGALELLTGKSVFNTPCDEIIQRYLPQIFKHLNYRHIMSSYKGMSKGDHGRLMMSIHQEHLGNIANADQTAAKTALVLIRSTICTLWYHWQLKQESAGTLSGDPTFFAGSLDRYFGLGQLDTIPNEIKRCINTLVEYRQGGATTNMFLLRACDHVLEWSNNVTATCTWEKGKDIPQAWDTYSPSVALQQVMAVTPDPEYNHFAVNHVLSPLQKVCQDLYNELRDLVP